MDFSSLEKGKKIYPVRIQKYERLIPDLDDQDFVTKMNSIVQYLNGIGKISSQVVDSWNRVMDWVMNEGLTEETQARINELVDSGTFDQLIEQSQAGWKAEVDQSLIDVDVQLAEKATKSSAAYAVSHKLKYNYEDVNIVVLGDSTGNENYEWVYLMAQRLGTLYPTHTVKYHLWDDATKVYGTATSIQTGTGTKVLNIWNASVSGRNLYYPMQHAFAAQVIAPKPDLIAISHGHNEGTLSTDLAKQNNKARYYLLTQYISRSIPDVPIMLIAQNPQVGTDVQKIRVPLIAEVASNRGYGFVNVHDAFLNVQNWETLLMGDSIHPNSEGAKVWVDEVMKQFVNPLGLTPLSQLPSSLDVPVKNLLVNGDFKIFDGVAVPSNWTPLGSPVFSKDTANFETKGYGVKMVTAANSSGSIYQTVDAHNLDLPLDYYKGKILTLAVRLRKPPGQSSTTGKVALYDGTQTMTSSLIYAGDGNYYWDCATMKVSETATTLRAYIYADTATAGNMEITFDRAILAFGVLPRDII